MSALFKIVGKLFGIDTDPEPRPLPPAPPPLLFMPPASLAKPPSRDATTEIAEAARRAKIRASRKRGRSKTILGGSTGSQEAAEVPSLLGV